MSSNKFEFTVSGINLTDEQKSAIRESIAEAVSTTLLAGKKDLRAIGRAYSNIHLKNGGMLMFAADAMQLSEQLKNQGIQQHKAGGE